MAQDKLAREDRRRVLKLMGTAGAATVAGVAFWPRSALVDAARAAMSSRVYEDVGASPLDNLLGVRYEPLHIKVV